MGYLNYRSLSKSPPAEVFFPQERPVLTLQTLLPTQTKEAIWSLESHPSSSRYIWAAFCSERNLVFPNSHLKHPYLVDLPVNSATVLVTWLQSQQRCPSVQECAQTVRFAAKLGMRHFSNCFSP